MTPERWNQIQEQLEAALAMEPAQRVSFLQNLGSTDRDLQREVESLLEGESAEKEFLKTAVMIDPDFLSQDQDVKRDPMIGRALGSYQITELLGVGGMGEVYRAFRADDVYRKQVAIKFVRAGTDSEMVVSRFKNERQILASLDHPNIAKLLDGGTTPEGVPYLVMELIEGIPIDDYCDAHKLDITARLRLFTAVCSAVQYAHSHLIVHRDLKPGNILVTADGESKLLDFGIAKILDPGVLGTRYEATISMLRLLTPSYASPEQVNGETIATTSDVYSLGVILYELLTGHHPYRTSTQTAEAISRAVLEFEPERPSSVVRRVDKSDGSGDDAEITPVTVSAVREGSLDKLRKRLSGDLDKIVLMALRKKPSHRYASVEQFAEDIRRHLNSLPVMAQGDDLSYRARKFVVRHKTGIAAAVIASVGLIAGTAVSVWQARIARAERVRAERRFNDVRKLANSLLFDVHDAIRDLPGSTPARKILLDKALEYLDSLAREASNDPALLRELATAYERVAEVQGHYLNDNLGDTGASLQSYQKGLALREQLVATRGSDWQDRLALANSYRNLASQLLATGDAGNALIDIRKAIPLSEALLKERPAEAKVFDEMSYDYEIEGHVGEIALDQDAIESSYRKAVETDSAWLRVSPDDANALHSYQIDLMFLADSMKGNGDLEDAVKDYNQSLEMARQVSQRVHSSRRLRDVAVVENRISQLYEVQGNWRKALDYDEQALEIYRQLISREPSDFMMKQGFAIAQANVGIQRERLVPGSGIGLMRQSAEIMENFMATDTKNALARDILASMYMALGEALWRSHKLRDSLGEYEKALSIYQALSTADVHNKSAQEGVATCKSDMAGVFLALKDWNAAAKNFSVALALLEPVLAGEKPGDWVLRTAADSYAGLADVELGPANPSSRGAAARRQHLERACQFYQKSWDAWQKDPPSLRNSHEVFSQTTPQSVRNKLDRCENLLKRADSSAAH